MNMTKDKKKTILDVSLGKPHKTILFNDETHDQVEVSVQIMKAINCTKEKAFAIMEKAHKSGSAIVFVGHKEKCELVASILEQINLSTKVEPA